MPYYDNRLWNNSFSHIYVERGAFSYPLTRDILTRLRKATVIPVEHYKDVFNRAGQDFAAQKNSPKLILAVRPDHFLFEGSEVCDHYGHERFYYATQMMNCLYDCEYCYLGGMYDSANVVAFVNTSDYFNAIQPVLPAYVSVSYDADLLAFERLFYYLEAWINFSAQNPLLTLEARTKSANFSAISHITPVSNVILSWTVSPERVTERFEKRTPPSHQRIDSLNAAIHAGWKVRLCIDPVLLIPGWEDDLNSLMALLSSCIDLLALYDISVGGFRMSKVHFSRIRKRRPASVLFSLPLVEQAGVMCYNDTDLEKIKQLVLRTWKH